MNELYSISTIISMTLFFLATHITPGPTNIMLLSSVLTHGHKKSLPFMIGNIFSYPLMMTLTGFGLGKFLIENPSLLSVLKYISIPYLLFMAYKIAKDTSSYDIKNQTSPLNFGQAFTYTLLNPKAWIVYTSALSLFVTSSQESMMQISIIVCLTLLSMVITVYVWSYGGVFLKRSIKDKVLLKKINQIMALLLILSIVPILL